MITYTGRFCMRVRYASANVNSSVRFEKNEGILYENRLENKAVMLLML